jgi:ribosomal protein L19
VPRVDVLNTRDERVGTFDGLLLSARSDSPLFLVLRRSHGDGQRRLIPIGSAWFDQTAEVIRVDDADVQRASVFELEEFERMTPRR